MQNNWENKLSQTQVTKALSQVVEPEGEAGHAESHLGMIIDRDHLNKVEDGVGVDDHYSYHHHHGHQYDKIEYEGDDAYAHRGDDDQGDEEEQVGEAESGQQVVEHRSHRPEKKNCSNSFALASKMPLYLYL